MTEQMILKSKFIFIHGQGACGIPKRYHGKECKVTGFPYGVRYNNLNEVDKRTCVKLYFEDGLYWHTFFSEVKWIGEKPKDKMINDLRLNIHFR